MRLGGAGPPNKPGAGSRRGAGATPPAGRSRRDRLRVGAAGLARRSAGPVAGRRSGPCCRRRQSLALVTGRPFTGLDHCDWLDLEGIRSEVEATIVDVALTVGEADLDAGDFPEALAAARAGLLASRYEERLHRLAVRAADAQGLTGLVKTLTQEMECAIGDAEPNEAA